MNSTQVPQRRHDRTGGNRRSLPDLGWSSCRQVIGAASSRSYAALQTSLSATLAVLFPPTCPVCDGELNDGAEMPGICQRCRADLLNPRPTCARCARPLPSHTAMPAGPRCPGCRNRRWAFHEAVALGVYGDRLREVVLRIKQPGNEPLTVAVGRLLADRCHAFNSCVNIDLLAPVPLHWTRRLRRGMSCPELLAEAMAGRLGVSSEMGLLRCRRKTNKQGTLLPTERRLNVRNAYRVSRKCDVQHAHIVLVDDVMTTGATASELARTLRRAGANRISLAVVARGIGFD